MSLIEDLYNQYNKMVEARKIGDMRYNYNAEKNKNLYKESVKFCEIIPGDYVIGDDMLDGPLNLMRKNYNFMVHHAGGCPACIKRRLFYAACAFCANDENPFKEKYEQYLLEKENEEEQEQVINEAILDDAAKEFVFGVVPDEADEESQEEQKESKNWLMNHLFKKKGE